MNLEFVNTSILTSKEEAIALSFSEHFGIGKEIASIIVSKGIKTIPEAENFLYPEKLPFNSPYLLTDMDKLIERIKYSADNGEKIVVYGDYDADGVCASYILFRAIKAYNSGSDVSVFIPDRKFGYGLSEETIEILAEEYSPDLVVTCDLGISCKDEIKTLIEDAGIDVVVSDHHELPTILPDCPCVNPKRDIGKYPCVDLCGAGVAYKIAQALVPDHADEYIEFAMIATIADSVPLLSENRAIVKKGLVKMNNDPSVSIKALIDGAKIKGEITSSTVAFVLAPRINASGRMGEAARSFMLFCQDDYDLALNIVEEISQDNYKRQKLCQDIFESAYSQYNKESDMFGVVIANEKWHSGLLGIVASKIAEEYHKPTILFTEVDGNFRGSGRSVDGINLFEALSSMSELFITFGGHSQACGLTIKKENFSAFKERFNEYLKNNAEISHYLPKIRYDIDCNAVDVNVKFLRSLSLLEPFGVGNPKPCFYKKVKSLMVYPSSNPNHLIGDGDDKYLTCFNFGKYLDVLRSGIDKRLILDFHIDEYNGKTYSKANLKSFYTTGDSSDIDYNEVLLNYLYTIDAEYYRPIAENDLDELLKNEPFGTLLIANTKEGIARARKIFDGKQYLEETNTIVVKSNLNRLLISPKTAINFEKFKTIVFVEEFSNIPYDDLPDQSNFYTLCDKEALNQLDVKQNRDRFVQCYMAIKALNNCNVLSYKMLLQPLSSLGLSDEEILTAYSVFKELELISNKNGKLCVMQGKKVDLNQSKIYSGLKV